MEANIMKYKKNLLRTLTLAMCISILPQQSYAMFGMAAFLEMVSSSEAKVPKALSSEAKVSKALEDKGYSFLAKCGFAFGTALIGYGIYKLFSAYCTEPEPSKSTDSNKKNDSNNNRTHIANNNLNTRNKKKSKSTDTNKKNDSNNNRTHIANNNSNSVNQKKPESTTFDQWQKACNLMPKNNENYKHTPLNLDGLMRRVRAYAKYTKTGSSLAQQHNWLGTMPKMNQLNSERFVPYVQKLCVKPGAQVAFHGDLHGDVHALNDYIADLNNKDYLDGFKITKDDFYMLFLGDYTDRGGYGAEVWYTILRLKLANPDHVFMVRGNHEDKELNESYGFMDELKTKFGQHNTQDYQELYNLYNLLPVALYLGSGNLQEMNYLQCCHGGLEIGYNPQPLLKSAGTIKYQLLLDQNNRLDRNPGIEKLNNKECIERIKKVIPKHNRVNNPQSSYTIGFMWNDFAVDTQTILNYDQYRGWKCGKTLTHGVLTSHSTTKHKVRGVFRAHQHGDKAMMRRILNRDRRGHADDEGVGKLWTDHKKMKQPGALWDGVVCTFLVAPAHYGKGGCVKFDYDAFGLLKTANKFENWRLDVTRLNETDSHSSSNSSSSSSSASQRDSRTWTNNKSNKKEQRKTLQKMFYNYKH